MNSSKEIFFATGSNDNDLENHSVASCKGITHYEKIGLFYIIQSQNTPISEVKLPFLFSPMFIPNDLHLMSECKHGTPCSY